MYEHKNVLYTEFANCEKVLTLTNAQLEAVKENLEKRR